MKQFLTINDNGDMLNIGAVDKVSQQPSRYVIMRKTA